MIVCIAVNYSKLNLSQKITIFINLTCKCVETVIPNTRFSRDHCWYNSLEIITICSGYKQNASRFVSIIIVQGSQYGLLQLWADCFNAYGYYKLRR